MNAQQYKEYEKQVAHFLKINTVRPGCYGPKTNAMGECREPFFSWQPCGCCHSALGGDREEYVFAPKSGEVFHANICSDCVYYLAYGKLDDTTMAEIETSEKQPKPQAKKTLRELGEIILKECGEAAARSGYKLVGTIDPEYVGKCALQFGDIQTDGTLN